MKYAWTILCMWLFGSLTFFGIALDANNNSFFGFGPSDDLKILGLNYPVDTWTRYSALSVYVVIQYFIITLIGSDIHKSLVKLLLGKSVGLQRYMYCFGYCAAYGLTALWTIMIFINMGITMTQCDFWLYSLAAVMIANAILMHKNIKKHYFDYALEPLDEIYIGG